MLSFYPQHISLSPQHSTFLSHLIRPQLMRLCLSFRFRVEEESIFTSASSWFFDVKVIKRSSAVCDTFSSTNNFQWNKFLSFCQSRFQLWRKMFGEAEASFFFIIFFPFFPGERVSLRGDKPVTISLQTEEQGAHLKQWHYWPTAIASQHFHERREREGAAVVGGAERSIKNLAYFQRKRGARQTRLSQSLSNCFLSKVLRATKNKWLMSKKREM